jgi:hypothetical protein
MMNELARYTKIMLPLHHRTKGKLASFDITLEQGI